MAKYGAEKRSGEERREAARRGVGPEMSLEQMLEGAPGDGASPGEEVRVEKRRYVIRREEDRELHDFLTNTGTN